MTEQDSSGASLEDDLMSQVMNSEYMIPTSANTLRISYWTKMMLDKPGMDKALRGMTEDEKEI